MVWKPGAVVRIVVLMAGGALAASAASMPQAAQAERPYAIPDRGVLSLTTEGSNAPVASVNYARIAPVNGSTPAGIGIFGYRNPAGELITEIAVPATPLLTSGRLFISYSTDIVNTGIAIANPNDTAVQIDFVFSDARRDVTDFGAGSVTLGPGEQLARFVSEAPYNLESGTSGIMTFTASVPVAAIALRELIQAPDDIVFTTMTVADLDRPVSETLILPHFIFGGVWQTTLVLINPTDVTLTGRMGFVDQGTLTQNISRGGQTTPIALNGVSQLIHDYSLAPRGFAVFNSTGLGFSPISGSFRVVPDEGQVAPITQALLSNVGESFLTLSETVVSPSEVGTAFRMYVERDGEIAAPGYLESGIAIVSVPMAPPTFENTLVTLALTGVDGSLVDSVDLLIPPSGQTNFFLSEVFAEGVLPSPFKGMLRVSASDGIAVMGLRARVNELGELLMTTTPPANEAGAGTNTVLIFPHLVDGAGWTTQTVLFPGVAGQVVDGVMRFFDVDGSPFDIVLE